MNLRQRTAYSVAAIFGLWFLISHVSSAVAQNYTLNSLFSVNEGQQSTGPIQPSINNLGQAAYARTVFDGVNPEVIFIHDGITETPFFNLTAAGFFTTPANVVINDNGAVAAQVGARPGSVCPSNVGSCLIRINADQSVTVLATAGAFGGGTADFGSFDQQISMNNSGQVAEGVTYPNATTAIVRIDETGITEIARPTATLINFSRPSINNSGVVAFTAQDLSGGCSPSNICVFSGTGGPLTKEGVQPPGGGVGFAPFINNNGLVLAGGPGAPNALIYTAQGGVVNTLVVGNEDPVFTSLSNQPSQNDLGQFVFVSGICCPGDFGMFTGNDPSQDTVVRSNQTVFGGTFLEIRTALHYINNGGQIVFAMTEVDGSGNPTTHIVRADPLPADNTPPDTTITSSPGAVTNSTSAIFSFTSTEAGSTFACRLDGSAFTGCTSPQSYSSLAPGSHTFQVRAIDAANNTDQTPASFTWIIDITPPDTTITSNPPATNSTSASFSFTSTEAGSTFECSLDGASFTSCTNPQNYTNLANSSHTFLVRATDPAGNTDPTPASHTWTVDTVPSAGFFLHGSGATANPSNLFLNGNSPTATTAKSKDSVGIKFSGGNPWTQIGTWTAQPALSSGTLSALGSLRTWIGLKNSDDQGTWYDLRAEVYKNSTLVASGEIFCIQGVTRNPDQAKEVAISFNSPPPMTFNGTDVLSLKILTRIGTNGSGAFCGGHSNAVGLRLYFDAVSRPSKLTATFSE